MEAINKTKHIDVLHYEHQLWLSEAKFYKEQLKIFQNRLAEVAAKNTNIEVRKQVEHFQNQFIIQKDQLKILTHTVNNQEEFLANYVAKHPSASEDKVFDEDELMEDKIATFKKLYSELKKEYNHFLSAWM